MMKKWVFIKQKNSRYGYKGIKGIEVLIDIEENEELIKILVLFIQMLIFLEKQ